MAKNLMSISQKMFAPAAFIARKINKKHHRKNKLGLNLDVVQESSLVSDFTPAEGTDGENSLADIEVSWRVDDHNHSPTVESVVDCPLSDEIVVSSSQPIDLAPESFNRETLLLNDSAEMLEDEARNNKYDQANSNFSKGIASDGVKYQTATISSNKFGKKGQELTETYALREKVSELEKVVTQQSDELACLKSAMADNLRRLKLLEESRASNQMVLLKSSYASAQATPRRSQTSRSRISGDLTPVRKQFSQTLNSSQRMSSTQKSTLRQSSNSSTPALNNIGVVKMNERGLKSFTFPSPDEKNMVLLTKSFSEKSKSLMMARPWRPAGTPNPVAPKVEKIDIIKQTREYFNATNKSPSPKCDSVFRPRLNANNKETSYNKDEGTIKMYLKGRSVHLHVPTFAQPIDFTSNGQLPNETLKLEWVYGYRGRDSRNNVYFLPTGEIIYFVAAVVVLYNMEEQTQRHYLGHNDDVKSLAIHPDKITVASGQVAGHSKTQGRPHIRIWSSVNLNTLHIIGLGDFERSVCCLSFSKADGGSLICAVDEANEHVLSIWQWDKEKKIVEAKSSTEPVLSADFHPLDNKYLVTCGKSHLVFWTLEDNQLSKKQAVYEKNEKPKFVLCQTFLDNGDLVTGDSSGNVICWNKESHKIDKIIVGAHEGPIFSMMLTKSGTLLTGGGKDRNIKEWSATLLSIGLERTLPESQGAVRMLSQGPGGMVLVGSTRNSILQGNTQSNDVRPIVEGHIEEMWGIATHPRQHRFVSVAYDKCICFWDSLTRQLIWKKEMTESLHSVCFHPLSEIIAIGCSSGRWLVIDTISREMIGVHTDGSEQIECVQFSTDGRLLAVGSRDNSIYIYNVSDNGCKYSRQGKCVGHSSFVTHLDWSTNGLFLRSNSGDYEELFWSSSTCRQVTSIDQVRDTDWATASCVIDWTTVGIWPEGADGTDVNAVSRGHHLPLLCTTDDFGRVNLYTYPSPYLKAPHHQYRGHSSHVTNVQFLFDDSRVITSGGKDSSIMQWEIL